MSSESISTVNRLELNSSQLSVVTDSRCAPFVEAVKDRIQLVVDSAQGIRTWRNLAGLMSISKQPLYSRDLPFGSYPYIKVGGKELSDPALVHYGEQVVAAAALEFGKSTLLAVDNSVLLGNGDLLYREWYSSPAGVLLVRFGYYPEGPTNIQPEHDISWHVISKERLTREPIFNPSTTN